MQSDGREGFVRKRQWPEQGTIPVFDAETAKTPTKKPVSTPDNAPSKYKPPQSVREPSLSTQQAVNSTDKKQICYILFVRKK
jgi:hypothetical protein